MPPPPPSGEAPVIVLDFPRISKTFREIPVIICDFPTISEISQNIPKLGKSRKSLGRGEQKGVDDKSVGWNWIDNMISYGYVTFYPFLKKTNDHENIYKWMM